MEYPENFSLEKLLAIVNSRIELIKSIAEDYFRFVFKEAGSVITHINFDDKSRGQQFGTVINITYLNERRQPCNIRYYVKTHAHSNMRSNPSSVDPKELVAYLVLQYIGLGPKVHFFYNLAMSHDFLIATQDVSFTKQQHNPDRKKSFMMYEQINWENEEMMTPESKWWLDAIEIFCYIFNLEDVTNNLSNYGRVQVTKTDKIHEKWRILDLQVRRYSHRRWPFDKLQSMQNVIPFFQTYGIAQRRPPGHKMCLLEATKKAHQEVAEYISEHAAALNINWLTAEPDLKDYVKAVEYNFNMMVRSIEGIL